MYANDLDGVLIHLDTIIDDSLRRGSRLAASWGILIAAATGH